MTWISSCRRARWWAQPNLGSDSIADRPIAGSAFSGVATSSGTHLQAETWKRGQPIGEADAPDEARLPSSPQRKTRALSIGVQDYSATLEFNRLNGPLNDIRLMHRVLTDNLGLPLEAIRVLVDGGEAPEDIAAALGGIDGPASHCGIRRAFETLRDELAEGDALYVHFSGHGSQVRDVEDRSIEREKRDQTWVTWGSRRDDAPTDLCPADAPDLNGFDILDDELNGWLAELDRKGVEVVLVSDSCHSATMTRDDATGLRTAPADSRSHPAYNLAYEPADLARAVRIGAAGDRENAQERTFDGRSYGAFTWYWAKAFAGATEGTAWEDAFKLSKRIGRCRRDRKSGLPRTVPDQHRQCVPLPRPIPPRPGALRAGAGHPPRNRRPPRRGVQPLRPQARAEQNALLAAAPGNKRALLVEFLQRSGTRTGFLQFVLLLERVRILLTTPEGWHSAVVEIPQEALNARMETLAAALRNRKSRPEEPAKALYDVLAVPLAERIDAAELESLLMHLDGRLRYIPFAALHNGERWLAERWSLVYYTAASERRAERGGANRRRRRPRHHPRPSAALRRPAGGSRRRLLSCGPEQPRVGQVSGYRRITAVTLRLDHR